VAGEIHPRDLRVSDAEREHVGQLLQRAVGQGRITLAEFDTRMVAAMAARTRAELNAQIMDIAQVAPQLEPKDLLHLRGGVGSIKRRGYWVAPPKIKVTGGMGDTLLDFSEAKLTSPVTTIDVKLGVGDLVVIVPPDATVDHDELRTTMGEIKDRTERRPVPSRAHFVIRGTVAMGSIKIKNPRQRSFRLKRGRRRASDSG
jgi:hypothetical protein